MVYDTWYMVYGIWYMSCMLYGIWCKVYGIWCMIHGIWYMVYGTWEGFRAGGGAFHKECLAHCQMEDRQLARILTELATLPRRICSPPCTLRALPRQTDTLSGAVQWKTDILACSSQKLVSQGRSPFCASVLSPPHCCTHHHHQSSKPRPPIVGHLGVRE